MIGRGLVVLLVAVSVGLMVVAAGRKDAEATGMIAFITGSLFVIAALAIGGIGGLGDPLRLASRLAELNGAVYAWGSLAIAAMYFLTDLSWHHAWQYPIYFAIPALFCIWIGQRLPDMDQAGQALWMQRLRWGSIFQLVVGVAAFAFLFQSGKLGQMRADWAANIVFSRGTFLLAELSLLGLVLDWLGQRRRARIRAE